MNFDILMDGMGYASGKVLIVDDDDTILDCASMVLNGHVARVSCAKDPKRIPDLLAQEDYDVVLLDMNFSSYVTNGTEGFYWLQKIKRLAPTTIVIVITAYGDVEQSVKAIKAGATDFVLKPWKNEKLLATVSAGMSLRQSRLEISRLRSREKMLHNDMDQPFQAFIGRSHSILKVLRTIEKVAKTDANVLIMGENGTGKELVARAMHRRSKRSNEIFLSVDMGAIASSLLETELFGHVKGAFTDAYRHRQGRFELASRGTLFLDEIGNLSLAAQAKILRVLETRSVCRVGSNTPIDIDIRLICATSMPIQDMVLRHEFRPDLFYRINTVEIILPPLRERGNDLIQLGKYFVKLFAKKYKKSIYSLSPATMRKLAKYQWPGNVRELRHAVERAVIMSDSHVLQPSDFYLPSMYGDEPDDWAMDNLNLEFIEKMVIRRAISKHEGNITRAARDLGLTRASLYRRLEKYSIMSS